MSSEHPPPAGVNRPPLDGERLRSVLLAPGGPARRVHLVERVGSTSSALAEAVRQDPEDWPAMSVLVADHQDAGRGRIGRVWQTPARAALTFSVLLRPTVPAEAVGWLTLVGGLAVLEGIDAAGGLSARLKWPNDVMLPAPTEEPAVPGGTWVTPPADHVPGWGSPRKVGGILAELLPPAPGGASGPTVVLGIGINVSQTTPELPVPEATSLLVAGPRPVDRTALLHAVLTALAGHLGAWEAAGGDAQAAGLADRVRSACITLGRRVRVDLPGGDSITGEAQDLADDGALLVRDRSGEVVAVHAGDVHHVRPAT